LEVKCNLNCFSCGFTFFFDISVALDSSTIIQDLIIFFAERESNCCENTLPISRDGLGLVLVHTDRLGQIVLSINLLFNWFSGGNFGNFMDDGHLQEIILDLDFPKFFVHLLIDELFFLFEFMDGCPGQFNWVFSIGNFFIDSLKNFFIIVFHGGIKELFLII
jgi:hypothetical protein